MVLDMTRRQLLLTAAAIPFLDQKVALAQSRSTEFQIGCMTITYSAFPLERALSGIKNAGYRYVGWGTAHERVPVMDNDAPPATARLLAAKCREMGLEPVIMFSTVNVEAPDSVAKHRRKLEQAGAAGIPYLITFGKTTAGALEPWIATLKQLGPMARANNVTVVIKQHGGNTGTGRLCSKILAEVADEGVKMCYDAGNVLDYEKLDPIPDIQVCWQDVRAFAIKDHRNTPKSQDCAAGFGEIDHYKLLMPLLQTGRKIPLVCENIFEPLLPRPAAPEGVDVLARRSREYLEVVVKGLQMA